MGSRILVVDDEVNITRLLEARLKAQGHEVLIARDGLEGLSMAREQNPDLVILDVMMPKLDGFKVCRMLKFDQNHQHIPVILLSARNQESDLQAGRELKADAYISKPYNPEELLKTISRLLSPASR